MALMFGLGGVGRLSRREKHEVEVYGVSSRNSI